MLLALPFWIDMAVPIFMIISGYLNYLSYQKSSIDDFEKAYRPSVVMPKVVRFTVPFAIVYVVEIILYTIQGYRFGISELIRSFFTGGYGPGSYYFPLMLQLIFVFPMIYLLVKKKGFRGVVICGVLNGAFEFLKWTYGMNEGFYRLVIFRYLLLIAYGCYLASDGYKTNKKLCWLSFGVGTAYLALVTFLGYKPWILYFWSTTSMLAAFYIMPLAMLLIRKCRFGFAPMELLGKASYHIFFAQMIYFNFANFFYGLVANRALQLLMSFGICLAGGILFYYLESPLSARMIKLVRGRCAKKQS